MTARAPLGAALFVLTLVIYILVLPPSILPGDSGELIAASRTLSIAHSPGSPLYLMLGKLFSSGVRVGSVAYRYNLLSAVFAAFAVALLYRLLWNVGVGRPVAAATALALAVQQAFWLQAIEAEVYAMSALFTVLLFYIASADHGDRAFLLLAFVGGLAVSHHTALLYALACALLFMFLRRRPATAPVNVPGTFSGRLSVIAPGTFLLGLFLLLLGGSVWLYIPIRAAQHPPLTWGETGSLRGLVSHITGERYAWRLKHFDPGGRLADVLAFLRMIMAQVGLPLAALSIVGLVSQVRRRHIVLPVLCMVLLYSIHSASYHTHDIDGHVVPAMIGLALLGGLGAQFLASRLYRVWRYGTAALAVALLAVFLAGAVSIRPRNDPWLAYDFAAAVAASAVDACGASPVLLASGEFVGLPLLYVSLVEGYDVIVFAPGTSDPSVIGASGPVESVEEAAPIVARNFGESKIVLLAGGKAESIAGGERICGLVYPRITPREGCRSPLDYSIRGVGEEMRDYYSRVLSAEYLLHLARWQLNMGEERAAREYAEEALPLAFDDAITNIEASRLYFEFGEPERALDLVQRAVEAEPTYFYARFALGNVLSMNERDDEAIEQYERALRGNPNPTAVHVNLGSSYRAKGLYAQSLHHYGRALEFDSGNINANLGMATTLEAMGRYAEAMPYIDRSLGADAAYAPAIHAKAALLMSMGRNDEARDILVRGLEAKQDEALLLSDMGLYYLRAGDLDAAIDFLNKALESQPTLLTARGNLAVAYERKGLEEEAAEQYRKYVETAPPGPLRDRANEALQALSRPR